MLRAMVVNETAQGFELNNQVDVAISTNSFRAVRGRPILCGILDETAFWRDESSATPDVETYNALKPATASLPGSMIIGISSLAVWLLGPLVKSMGFAALLWTMAAIAAIRTALLLFLPDEPAPVRSAA